MLHFLFLCVFCLAVGVVLGAMLRSDTRDAVVLGLWIALGMIAVGMAIAWVMYLLPF